MSTAQSHHASALSPELTRRLDEIVRSEPVVLFMKGSRQMPQCGFSSSVVDILDEHLDEYRTVDVLIDNELREGLKTYSDWPTIPQLYVGGEFVGGADIVRELETSGELKAMLRRGREERSPLAGGPAKAPPTLTFTEKAIEIAQASREDDDGPYLRLEVSPEFEHGLAFDVKGPDDFVVELQSGLTVICDPYSAARADGVHVDYVESDEKSGFKIDNPNPAKMKVAPLDAPAPEMHQGPPEGLTITDAAMEQFVGAIAEEEGDGPFGIRVLARRMGAEKCDYELDIIAASEKDEHALEVKLGELTVWVDPFSARNLDGATIDFVETEKGAGFKFENPRIAAGWSDPRATRFEQLLEQEINPSIASHGGVVHLCDVQGDTAWVVMGGGCQGCGMAGVTLNQGIEQRVREVIPSIASLVDTTDHASGTNPYFARR